MFKRKKHGAPAEPTLPVRPVEIKPDPLEVAAERETLRAKKIAVLAAEAKMWRAFVADCKSGRVVSESWVWGQENARPLCVCMDEITAKSWKAFAESMAGIAEQRLREILG